MTEIKGMALHMLVDFLRIQLFRLLHIDLLSQKICELLGKPIGKIKNKIAKVI